MPAHFRLISSVSEPRRSYRKSATRRHRPVRRHRTHSRYNLPSQITQGATSVNFLYDADHMRIRQVSTSETAIYLNPRIDQGLHFEKEVKGGITEYKHYIYGAAGVVGVYTTSSAVGPTTRYFHQDHLGSIVAVTDDAATVVARFAFDPWGKRLLLAGDANATHHGFTGHEHLDDVGLIHANGRIYDPVLARFMSADPYIQSPDNLQSYNRYSYVWNNPLSATDPSGYFSFRKFFRATLRFAFNPSPKNTVALIHNQPGQQYADQALLRYPLLRAAGQIAAGVYGGPIGAAAYASYIAGLQGGGNFAIIKAGAISYGTAAAFYAVGSAYPFATDAFANVAGHAAVGCLSALAGGGSCQSGAAAAGLGAVAGGLKLEGTAAFVAATVAGGIGAELGGGKFANGAVTGAFGYLFNDALHKTDDSNENVQAKDALAADGFLKKALDKIKYLLNGVYDSNLKGNSAITRPTGSILDVELKALDPETAKSMANSRIDFNATRCLINGCSEEEYMQIKSDLSKGNYSGAIKTLNQKGYQ